MIAKIMAKTVSNGVMDLFLFPWLDNIHPNMEGPNITGHQSEIKSNMKKNLNFIIQ